MGTKWRSVSIPQSLFDRIKGVYVYVGFPSISEYVRHQLVNSVRADEYRAEAIKERLGTTDDAEK